MGKFGNSRGYVLRGQEVAHYHQYINATLLHAVIAIVWHTVIGRVNYSHFP